MDYLFELFVPHHIDVIVIFSIVQNTELSELLKRLILRANIIYLFQLSFLQHAIIIRM